MAKDKPIELAGLRKGGPSPNGDMISFYFQSQDGREFAFSCPHEAITEIVEALELLAEMAWKRRGSPTAEDVIPGSRGVARSRSVTGLRADAAREGIVLSLVCGPLIHQVTLAPTECIQLIEAVQKAEDIRRKEFPPN